MSMTATRSTPGDDARNSQFPGRDCRCWSDERHRTGIRSSSFRSKLDNRRVLAAVVDLLIVAAGGVVILFAGDSLSGDRQGALAAVILGWALYYFFALESGEGRRSARS